MKHTYTILLSLLVTGSLKAQITSVGVLEKNQVRAHVSDNGVLFHDPITLSPGYNVPKNQLAHAIYQIQLQFVGRDEDGNLRAAVNSWFENNWSSGPVRDDYTIPFYNSMMCIERNQIETHIDQFGQPGYSIPPEINLWPAHGTIEHGEAANLAPFVDVNNNGIYEPELGEYPCIKGDQMCYLIMNNANPNQTAEFIQNTGIECHIRVYQFAHSVPAINESTFFDITVINRSNTDYSEFLLGLNVDGDLGYASDDYLGTDTLTSTLYFYNGDAYDESADGFIGYGDHPPAIGVTSLSAPLAVTYHHSTGFISNALQLYHILTGKNPMGAPRAQIFEFPASSLNAQTEVELNNTPGDRSAYLGVPSVELPSGSSFTWKFAVTYGQHTSDEHVFSSVPVMLENTAAVRQFESGLDSCAVISTASLESVPSFSEPRVYPNPVRNELTIQGAEHTKVTLTNLTGQQLHEVVVSSSFETIDLSSLPDGIYFLTLQYGDRKDVHKIIKE